MVIRGETCEGYANLLEVVDAVDALGLRLGLADGRKQDCRQDSDNGNNRQ
jgi:hypothetical protein